MWGRGRILLWLLVWHSVWCSAGTERLGGGGGVGPGTPRNSPSSLGSSWGSALARTHPSNGCCDGAHSTCNSNRCLHQLSVSFSISPFFFFFSSSFLFIIPDLIAPNPSTVGKPRHGVYGQWELWAQACHSDRDTGTRATSPGDPASPDATRPDPGSSPAPTLPIKAHGEALRSPEKCTPGWQHPAVGSGAGGMHVPQRPPPSCTLPGLVRYWVSIKKGFGIRGSEQGRASHPSPAPLIWHLPGAWAASCAQPGVNPS